MSKLMPVELMEQKIYLIRGQKVMIDYDLAILYGIETKQLKRQVNRNKKRFPSDFMFQLAKEEFDSLRCQFGTLKRGAHPKYPPYVFTEQGIAMLSSVISSERAITVNIAIMRAFVKMRQILATHKELAEKLKELENKLKNQDKSIKVIFDVIRKLIDEPVKPNKRIGFLTDKYLQK